MYDVHRVFGRAGLYTTGDRRLVLCCVRCFVVSRSVFWDGIDGVACKWSCELSASLYVDVYVLYWGCYMIRGPRAFSRSL